MAGVVIKKELARLGWSVGDLAAAVNCPVGIMNQIITGERGVGQLAAVELGKVLGAPAKLFISDKIKSNGVENV
ncbi:MAG: hypothetical protein KBC57_03285 [Neisseriaceae bacterium]|nr:hypothetical protein [Neisseriaceae bacterium]